MVLTLPSGGSLVPLRANMAVALGSGLGTKDFKYCAAKAKAADNPNSKNPAELVERTWLVEMLLDEL